MQCKDGSTVHVRKSVEPDPEQKKNILFNDNCGKIKRCSARVEGDILLKYCNYIENKITTSSLG